MTECWSHEGQAYCTAWGCRGTADVLRDVRPSGAHPEGKRGAWCGDCAKCGRTSEFHLVYMGAVTR